MSEVYDMIRQLEEKKAKIEQAIASLRAIDESAESPSRIRRNLTPPSTTFVIPKIDEIKNIIRIKNSARAADIARELGVPKRIISEQIAKHSEDFTRGKQGWITLV